MLYPVSPGGRGGSDGAGGGAGVVGALSQQHLVVALRRGLLTALPGWLRCGGRLVKANSTPNQQARNGANKIILTD